MTRLTITEQNNNGEFHLRVGDELIVRLEAIPGAGYSWIVSGNVEGVLSQSGQPVFEKSGKRVLGGVEQQVFTFQVSSPGAGVLKLEYRRPWEKPATAIKTFSIRVIAEA